MCFNYFIFRAINAKFNEKCTSDSDCDQSQGLKCLTVNVSAISLFCSCTADYYHDSASNTCGNIFHYI